MSEASAIAPRPQPPHDEDQRIFMSGVTWSEYETLLAVRGDRAGIRIAYLKGDLEIMSPSLSHEWIKKTEARLLEAYSEERGIEMNGFGSWTIKLARKERGVEPDECYIFGIERKEAPDLAIEVLWTHGGLDKLETYSGLGVREVWIWRDGRIHVHELRGDHYEVIERSRFVPELDLEFLPSFVDRPSQIQSLRDFRAALRAG
jgi:Uma2 family endonuclease